MEIGLLIHDLLFLGPYISFLLSNEGESGVCALVMTGKRHALINKRMKPHLLNSQRCYIHFNCINQWKIFRTNFKSSIVLFVEGDNVIRWPFDCFMLFWKMNFPHGRNFSCLGKELAIRDVPRIFVFPKFLPSMHHANVDKAFVFFQKFQCLVCIRFYLIANRAGTNSDSKKGLHSTTWQSRPALPYVVTTELSLI